MTRPSPSSALTVAGPRAFGADCAAAAHAGARPAEPNIANRANRAHRAHKVLAGAPALTAANVRRRRNLHVQDRGVTVGVNRSSISSFVGDPSRPLPSNGRVLRNLL